MKKEDRNFFIVLLAYALIGGVLFFLSQHAPFLAFAIVIPYLIWVVTQ